MTTDLLNNRFNLLQPLSESGKTYTHLASDTETGKQVVIKELNLDDALDWKSIELFERESKILQHLKHPAIPNYIDAFHTDDGTRLFLVQEYIDGENLESLLNNSTAFDENRVRKLLEQMLDVLVYLHSFSPPVIHRNIKPSNILCDTDGQFHLVDFGEVQTIVQDQIGGSTIVGTTGYMPPEQLLGRAQPATDIYALAATCVHLSSDTHPADLPSKLMKLQFQNRVSLSEPLCQILEKMLEPDVSERFARPEHAQNALQNGKIIVSDAHNPQNKPQKHLSSSTTSLQLNSLKTLITNPPVSAPLSKVKLENDTLTITINVPLRTPWLGLFSTIWVGLLLLALGFTNPKAFQLGYLGFGVLFLGIPILVNLAEKKGQSGFEQIIASPTDIQIISGELEPKKKDPTLKNLFQIPIHKLKKCYLEAEFEKFTAYAKSGNVAPQQRPRPSGMYFIDDTDRVYYFRTTGITKRGKIIGASPDAYPEMEWLFDIVQAYLQSLIPSDPQTPDLLDTETPQLEHTNQT